MPIPDFRRRKAVSSASYWRPKESSRPEEGQEKEALSERLSGLPYGLCPHYFRFRCKPVGLTPRVPQKSPVRVPRIDKTCAAYPLMPKSSYYRALVTTRRWTLPHLPNTVPGEPVGPAWLLTRPWLRSADPNDVSSIAWKLKYSGLSCLLV